MLKVEQTVSCDICGSEMRNVKQIVPAGAQIPIIERGPAGVTQWHDVCGACHDPLLKAVWALKTAKDAE
jgi:hypothetical protein